MQEMMELKSFDGGKKRDVIIGAADIGYGYTKYGSNRKGDCGRFELRMFPSLAGLADRDSDEQSSSILSDNKNLVVVDVKGRGYKVGPDSHLNQGERSLSEKYIESDEHYALLKGALAYSNSNFYDVYVVGLPVTHMRNTSKINTLKEIVKGTHKVGERNIVIKEVVILPQPMGAYMTFANGNGAYAKLKKERVLVCDPGRYTFDYYVTENGKPIDHLCGSHNFSVNRIINDISKNIGKHIGGHYDSSIRIEEAIASGVIRLKGEELAIEQFISDNTRALIRDAISRMRNSLEHVELIEKVLVCGGAANLFTKDIEESLNVKPVVFSTPIFANLKGYLIAGAIKSTAKS